VLASQQGSSVCLKRQHLNRELGAALDRRDRWECTAGQLHCFPPLGEGRRAMGYRTTTSCSKNA